MLIANPTASKGEVLFGSRVIVPSSLRQWKRGEKGTEAVPLVALFLLQFGDPRGGVPGERGCIEGRCGTQLSWDSFLPKWYLFFVDICKSEISKKEKCAPNLIIQKTKAKTKTPQTLFIVWSSFSLFFFFQKQDKIFIIVVILCTGIFVVITKAKNGPSIKGGKDKWEK